jgi:hypothetical protein
VAWADRPQGGGGLSAGTRRTVYELAVDCPKMVPKPPVEHRKKRTVRPLLADRPPNHEQPKTPGETD